MKFLSKYSSACAIALLFGTNFAHADDKINVSFNGLVNGYGITRSQKDVPKIDENISNFKPFAIATNTHFSAIGKVELDSVKYGARISLETTSESGIFSSAFRGTYIFLESDYGRWELGSGTDASNRMRVFAGKIAQGSIIPDIESCIWVPSGVPIEFAPVVNAGNPGVTGIANGNIGIETARKITYFTPKFADKVQFGISYIPDSSNVGITSIKDQAYLSVTKNIVGDLEYSHKRVATDIFAFGTTFSHNISDDIDILAAVTVEYGKAAEAGIIKSISGRTLEKTSYKLNDIMTYSFGAILTYGNVSVAGSITERGKTLLSEEIDDLTKGNNRSYTAGIAYVQGPLGVSFDYNRGDRFGNKSNIYSIGTKYEISSGLTSFLEYSMFDYCGKKHAVYKDDKEYKSSGSIISLGLQMRF